MINMTNSGIILTHSPSRIIIFLYHIRKLILRVEQRNISSSSSVSQSPFLHFVVTDNIFQLFMGHLVLSSMHCGTSKSVPSFDEEVPPKLMFPTSKITWAFTFGPFLPFSSIADESKRFIVKVQFHTARQDVRCLHPLPCTEAILRKI